MLNPKRVALYLRVSTEDQDITKQIRVLKEVSNLRPNWKIRFVFSDEGVSGAKGSDERPGLDRLLNEVEAGNVDLVAVWALDRLGSSVVNLVDILDTLKAKGCDLYLHKEQIDTTNPYGVFLFQFMGAIAELDQKAIGEKTKAGRARANAEGVIFGRPSIGGDKHVAIRELRREGWTIRELAIHFGASKDAIAQYCRGIPA